MFDKNFKNETKIKFSELKKLSKPSISKLIDDGINIKYLAITFINIINRLHIHHPYIYISTTDSYFKYMKELEKKNNLELVIKVIDALISETSDFDNYQLDYDNNFAIDIAGMCGIKLGFIKKYRDNDKSHRK